MKKSVAIVGGGPAGCICAYYALQNKNLEITIFDDKPLLSTILPTGNGRCNFTYGEFDIRELVKYYPRGEKFLYSVFSQFSPSDTLNFFDKLGLSYYMQDDFRYFPTSDKSKDVQNIIVSNLLKHKNFNQCKQKINDIKELFSKYDYVVVATGSNPKILENLEQLYVKTIPFKQALVGLKTKQSYLHQIPGVTLKKVRAKFKNNELTGDILITHSTVSGPLIYKISSIMAFEKFPYKIHLNFTDYSVKNDFDDFFKKFVKENNNKNIINVLNNFIPNSLAQMFLTILKIDENSKCHQLTKENREKLTKILFAYELDIIGTQKQGETVKAGGVDTDFINPKSMQHKAINNLFIIGEMLNIDGFCGGFNLQNCWSTGAICGQFIGNSD